MVRIVGLRDEAADEKDLRVARPLHLSHVFFRDNEIVDYFIAYNAPFVVLKPCFKANQMKDVARVEALGNH